MNIGLITDAPGAEGKISASFSQGEYLLIFDTDRGAIISTYPRGKMTDCEMSRKLIYHDCEAVICGPIEREPFLIIADEGYITRYDGVGRGAAQAVRAMEQNELAIIPDHIGGKGCGSHEHSACECGHPED